MRSRDVACVLSRKVDVPPGKKTALELAVSNHPQGDWKLVVRIDGEKALAKSIEESRWQELRVDLTKHAGKTVIIELENRASGWAFEAGYWSQIELVSK